MHHVSACPTYKQDMKAIGVSLKDEHATGIDHESLMGGLIAKFGSVVLVCNQEGHFK